MVAVPDSARPQSSAGSRLLLAYTRTPTVRQEANNADIALSLHLALRSPATGEWEPLNENYGIGFARGDSTAWATAADGRPRAPWRIPGVDVRLAALVDPFVARTRNGGFAILATRRARGGAPDGSEKSSALLILTSDLLDFSDQTMLVFRTTAGVHHPRMLFDAASNDYLVTWEADDGTAWGARLESLTPEAAAKAEATRIQPPARPIAGYPDDDLSVRAIPGCVPSNAMEISEPEARALEVRYGRAYDTTAEVPDIIVPRDGASGEQGAASGSSMPGASVGEAGLAGRVGQALAAARASLGYSDGSHGTLAVDWDQDPHDIARRLGDGRSAAVIVTGRIRQTRYPVPFAVERADPSVFAWTWNGRPVFLFIATDDKDGNCIDPSDGPHMPLRMASTVMGLSDMAGGRAHEVSLLKAGDRNSEGRAMTGCFWAPELHVIGGRLSILFMPCFDGEEINPDTGTTNPNAGRPDMWTGCCHVMQLKRNADGTDPDPRDPTSWTVPEPILRADGTKLNPVRRISLDMTYFEDSGNSYYAWQQEGSVWIARVDPAHPARLVSEPRQVVVPEYAWDNTIAEGPNVIRHDGRLFLIYSGSLVGIDYTTGLATATAGTGADLSDPAGWTKLDYPLQKSGIYNGAWQLGTGHGMFSRDEDGNLLYVFHAANDEHGAYHGRDAQVRRVHWAADGLPVLDMQEDEEVAPHLRSVSARIRLA